MDQYSSQSVRKDHLFAEFSSFSSDDGTKKVLDSLGKFKTSQTVSQTKVRPYRSNASDDESPGPTLSREKQEAKSRETSYHRTSTSQKNDAAKTCQSQSSRSTSVRYSGDRAGREDKTTARHSTSVYSSASSTHRPSNSKDTGSSTLRGSQRLSKSPKKELSGEKQFEMRDTSKERHQVDSSNKSQQNREQCTATIQNDRSENDTGMRFMNAYQREQADLQKRIEELKKEISDQKSKFIEKSSHINDVASKSERSKESILASSSSHRTATESSKPERKDDRTSQKSLDYRQKASEEKSKVNEMASDNVAVKSERNKESFRASSSSHGTGTESSKHQNKDERVSHKSDDYRQRASKEPQSSGSGDIGRHQRQNNDKSRKSRSRSLGRRIEGGDRNIRSRSPRRLSHSRGDRTARSQSRNHDRSPKSRSQRSRSIERRSRRSRSRRSRSRSTRSQRSRSHDRRTSSKSKSLRDCVSKDKPYVKQDEEKAREHSNLHSRHGQRSNSPVFEKKQRSRSRSRSPHYKTHRCSGDGYADDSRNAVNKYLSSRHSPKIVRSDSRDPPEELSISRRSPSSACSFELDWPRSPRQPGMNMKARGDCVSPMSQLYASGEARIYKDVGVPVNRVKKKTEDRDGGKFSKDWLLSSILGPRLLVKRDAQRNSVVSIWAERTIDCFEVIRTIGRGTYGQVYKAADKDKNLLVAVKRITASSKHGFPLSAVREMTCLHLLDHPNIIRLLEIIRDTKGKESTEIMGMYYYVYEYVAHDLKGIIESKLVKLSPDDISGIMIQLLNAVDYCHSHNLVHRNIKSSNILINYRGELKLTQFGMSRILHNTSQKDRPYTTTVTNLWYRSPELLLGSDLYETTVDLWGCGCVLGEMFLQKPLFPGRDDLHQLHLISTLCGSPSATVWPDVTLLPLYYTIQSRAQHQRRLREEFCFVPVAALDLLDLLLTLDPKKRSTATEALRMDWLRDINLHKLPPIHLPKTVDCHSLSEESKSSESKSELVTTGTKRPLSPDASQDARARKRPDLGLVLREAVEALQQRSPVDARSSVPTSESSAIDVQPSATDRSIPEIPASSKPKLLNLRVKDYQHQTVSPSKADYLQQKNDPELQRLLPQRQLEDKLTYNRTEDQSCERQSGKSVNKVTDFPGSDFSADPGLSYKELTPSRPGLQPAVDKTVPASSTVTSASMSLSSSSARADPVLPESSVAFWNAMKVYCAKLDGSKSSGTAAAVANQMAAEKPFQPRTGSLYRPTEADYQLTCPKETVNLMKKPNIYSGHPYADTMYGERTQHRPVELDTDSSNSRKIPPGSFSYDRRDYVSDVNRSRLPPPPSRKETIYGQTDSMPNHSFDVDSRVQGYVTADASPCFPSVISKTDTKVESSTSAPTSIPLTRVQYISPRAAEKPVPYKETPTSVQSVRTDDSKPVDPPASGTNFSAASGDGPSTAQGTGAGAGLESTNTRPKLTGILKNRIEVKTTSNIEWKTLQPKQ